MRKKVAPIQYEEDEQIAFVRWCQLNGLIVHHSGNEIGGSTSAMKARAVKMKKMGTSKGFPDLLVFIPVKGTTGFIDCYQMCAVEMKRRKGSTTTKEQKEWLKILGGAGCIGKVCKGADEAIAFIKKVQEDIYYE